MTTTIDHRVLLPDSLDERFFERRVFVTVDSVFNLDTMIQLCVTIPGETEEVHNKMRDELRSYLQRALIGIDNDWVVEVERESNSEEPVIVVHINDAQLMGFDSEELVLNAVRAFMSVKAKRAYRELTILSACQLLVPLHFKYRGLLNDMVTLKLPEELKLVDTFGRHVDLSTSESYEQACGLLQETIKVALRSKSFDLKLLDVRATRRGVELEVYFDETNPLKAYQRNMLEAIVAHALSTHCHYAGVYEELVFQPVSRHAVELDDDSEPSEGYY